MYKLDLENAEEPEIKLPVSVGLLLLFSRLVVSSSCNPTVEMRQGLLSSMVSWSSLVDSRPLSQ